MIARLKPAPRARDPPAPPWRAAGTIRDLPGRGTHTRTYVRNVSRYPGEKGPGSLRSAGHRMTSDRPRAIVR
jgi:hypothetical protein